MIWKAKELITKLLYDEVLENTYGCVKHITVCLGQIITVGGDKEFEELLLKMTSEALRGCLHKHEIPVTNGLIAQKNRILRDSGIEIPESHQLIDASKYVGVNW